ncbi:MAG: hypothetical protein AVDCRST_MAG93-9759, partial [uncultured Chloroflexia bacterium]
QGRLAPAAPLVDPDKLAHAATLYVDVDGESTIENVLAVAARWDDTLGAGEDTSSVDGHVWLPFDDVPDAHWLWEFVGQLAAAASIAVETYTLGYTAGTIQEDHQATDILRVLGHAVGHVAEQNRNDGASLQYHCGHTHEHLCLGVKRAPWTGSGQHSTRGYAARRMMSTTVDHGVDPFDVSPRTERLVPVEVVRQVAGTYSGRSQEHGHVVTREGGTW